MDIDSYFARLGIGSADATPEGLRTLQGAQMRAITFENIEPLLGGVPDVRPDAVFDKLVARGRGGYCFELNTLFEQAMNAVGFRPRRVLCRVRNGAERGGPRSHLAFVVTVAGEDWLTDTGFGGPGAPVPLRLADPATQPTVSGRYRLRVDAAEGETVLDRETADGWFALFGFDDARATDADIVSANFVCAKSDTAPFPANLMVSRHLENGRISLFNTAYREERDGSVDKRVIASSTELHDLLTGEFALALDPAMTGAVWDRLAELGKLDGAERRMAG